MLKGLGAAITDVSRFLLCPFRFVSRCSNVFFVNVRFRFVRRDATFRLFSDRCNGPLVVGFLGNVGHVLFVSPLRQVLDSWDYFVRFKVKEDNYGAAWVGTVCRGYVQYTGR